MEYIYLKHLQSQTVRHSSPIDNENEEALRFETLEDSRELWNEDTFWQLATTRGATFATFCILMINVRRSGLVSGRL